jgi:hypothetical protein
MQSVKVRFAYKSGFRRLWLVISALWALTVFVIVWRDFDVTIRDGFMIVLIPVAGAYFLGAAFVWIVEGFARADR